MYEPPLPSASSAPTASRRHLLAPTILSLFFDPFFLALPLLRDLCTRVCPCDHLCVYVAHICTYMHVYTRYVFNTRCACTRERRKENEPNRDEEGLTRVCETERETEKQGAQSETLEWEIIKMAARATYSTSSTPPPPPPIPTLLFLLFGRPTRRAASRGNRQALRRTI